MTCAVSESAQLGATHWLRQRTLAQKDPGKDLSLLCLVPARSRRLLTQRVREAEVRWTVTLNKITNSGSQSGPELNDKFSMAAPLPSAYKKSKVPKTGVLVTDQGLPAEVGMSAGWEW